MAGSVRLLLEWLSILMLVITLQLPQGPVLYWASSATFTLIQVCPWHDALHSTSFSRLQHPHSGVSLA